MKRYGKSGWFKESYRHYLAAKGVSTSRYTGKSVKEGKFRYLSELTRNLRQRAIEIQSEEGVTFDVALKKAREEFADVPREYRGIAGQSKEEIEKQSLARILEKLKNGYDLNAREQQMLREKYGDVLTDELAMAMFNKSLRELSPEEYYELERVAGYGGGVRGAKEAIARIRKEMLAEQIRLATQQGFDYNGLTEEASGIRAFLRPQREFLREQGMEDAEIRQFLESQYPEEVFRLKEISKQLASVRTPMTPEVAEELEKLKTAVGRKSEEAKKIQAEIESMSRGFGDEVTERSQEAMEQRAKQMNLSQRQQINSLTMLRDAEKQKLQQMREEASEYYKSAVSAGIDLRTTDYPQLAEEIRNKQAKVAGIQKMIDAEEGKIYKRSKKPIVEPEDEDMKAEREWKKRMALAGLVNKIDIPIQKKERELTAEQSKGYDMSAPIEDSETKEQRKLRLAEMDERRRIEESKQLGVTGVRPGTKQKMADTVSVGDATITSPGYFPEGIQKPKPDDEIKRRKASRVKRIKRKKEGLEGFDGADLIDAAEDVFD